MTRFQNLFTALLGILLFSTLNAQKPTDVMFAYKGEASSVSKERSVNASDLNVNTNTSPRIGCSYGDCYEGVGILEYADGSKYEGNFVDGVMTGYGTWYFSSGETCHLRTIYVPSLVHREYERSPQYSPDLIKIALWKRRLQDRDSHRNHSQ